MEDHKIQDHDQHDQEEESEEQHFSVDILDIAIDYVMNGHYPTELELTSNEKRSVRRKAKTIVVEEGEVFMMKKGKKVCCSCMH